jgi:hypothetical protein
MIKTQTKTFKLDLNKLLAKAGRNAGAVARKVALRTYTKIVQESPVDSEEIARRIWDVGINNEDLTRTASRQW